MFSFITNSCSWQETFVIKNLSNEELVVYYELKKPDNLFPIFNYNPNVYQLNSSGDIEWGNEKNISDMDTSILQIKIILPPKHALVMGHLSNDKYKKYNQYFINGRVFNLQFLKISNRSHQINIVPETFDKYFKKQSGSIHLGISD